MKKKQQPSELPIQSKSSSDNNFLAIINSNIEKNIILYERGLTLNSTLNVPTLGSLIRKKEGSKPILTALTFLVMRASKKEAIYKEIEDDTAFALAVDLLELFEFDTIQDVSLLFKFARMGKLKLDPLSKKKSFYEKVLSDYVPAYLEMKSALREGLHEEKKKNLLPGSWTPENRRKLRELIEEVTPVKQRGDEFVKKNTSLENQDSFIEELTEDAKNTTKPRLEYFVKKWSKDNGMSRYVYILENELKSRENGNV